MQPKGKLGHLAFLGVLVVLHKERRMNLAGDMRQEVVAEEAVVEARHQHIQLEGAAQLVVQAGKVLAVLLLVFILIHVLQGQLGVVAAGQVLMVEQERYMFLQQQLLMLKEKSYLRQRIQQRSML